MDGDDDGGGGSSEPTVTVTALGHSTEGNAPAQRDYGNAKPLMMKCLHA